MKTGSIVTLDQIFLSSPEDAQKAYDFMIKMDGRETAVGTHLLKQKSFLEKKWRILLVSKTISKPTLYALIEEIGAVYPMSFSIQLRYLNLEQPRPKHKLTAIFMPDIIKKQHTKKKITI